MNPRQPCKFHGTSSLKVIWEITNQCNFGCSYCIFSSTNRKLSNELSTEQSLNLILQIAEAGTHHIKFTGGEPFMRPDLFSILKGADDVGLPFDVSTNASVIWEENARSLSLLQNLAFIHVSLDGASEDEHELVRGEGTFKKTLRGLGHLCQAGIPVRLGTVIHAGNEHSLPALIDLCNQYHIRNVAFSLMEPVGRMRLSPQHLAVRSAESIQTELFRLSTENPNLKIENNFLRTSGECSICQAGKNIAYIDAEGLLHGCTWLKEKGLLQGHDLRENAFSDALRKIKIEIQDSYPINRYSGCPV